MLHAHQIRRTFLRYRYNCRCAIRFNSSCHWFFATDVPKSDPYQDSNEEETREPTKFIAFSKNDSDRIEKLYQQTPKKDERRIIPVKEDYLFNVDVDQLELRPSYWKGPTYDIRRGLWFNSLNQPLNPDLAAEIEEKFKSINFEELETTNDENKKSKEFQDIFKLSAPYKEGKFVLFVDKNVAFLLQDVDGGEFQIKFLRSNIGQSIPINGMKITRGYDSKHGTSNSERVKNLVKEKETSTSKPESNKNDSTLGKLGSLLSFESSSGILSRLAGAISDTSDATADNDNKKQYMKNEMEHDYYDEESTSSESKDKNTINDREINHLVLCVHGIGQTLGKTYEYVNFVHTINLLRSNMKKLYSAADDLKNLNKLNRYKDWQSNSNVQVLPITWRHSITFQTDRNGPNLESPLLPTLDEITVDGIVPFRKLMADGIFDILLYCDPYYKKMIKAEVTKQLNTVYKRFVKFNPNFNGKVHLVGHSLGSMILFDLLSNKKDYKLEFEVGNFFGIGSPIGILKLIQRTMVGQKQILDADHNVNFQLPECQNYYNIFHVCDPVAYRVESFVDRRMAEYEHTYVPHWSESDGIASKMLEMGGNILKEIPLNSMITEKNEEENTSKSSTGTQYKLPEELKSKLLKLNYSGRIDYALRSGILDIDILSALSSHVSYFEEPDIAGFLLKEILAGHKPVEQVTVTKSKLFKPKSNTV